MNAVPHTKEVPVSVREVSDVTYRVLRSAGIPSGCAMRAAAMVQHAEVYHGIGLRMLHRRLDLAESGADPAALEVGSGTADMLTIDATGTSALVAGPPALDLARARAASEGASAVWLPGVRDASLLDELAYRAAASGLICILSWAVSDPAEELENGRTVVAGAGQDGIVAVELSLDKPSRLLRAVASAAADSAENTLPGTQELADHEKARAVIEDALTPADTDGETTVVGAALLCFREPSEKWFELFSTRACGAALARSSNADPDRPHSPVGGYLHPWTIDEQRVLARGVRGCWPDAGPGNRSRRLRDLIKGGIGRG